MPNPPRIEQAAQWIDQQRDEICETICRWASQNSWSKARRELDAMASLLIRDFAKREIILESIPLPNWDEINGVGIVETHGTGPALLWHGRPDASRRVLLAIHYDTVYPPDLTGQSVKRDEERLYGPGVADAKGGIAVILWAVHAIQKFRLAPDLGITVLLNPDEEIGSPASASLFESLAAQFEVAFLFEPSLASGEMVVDRKGTGNFTAVIRGRAAHAGRDISQGRNAIVQASRLAIEVDSWNRGAEGPGCGPMAPSPFIVNVGRIEGGGALNKVPDFASLSMNVRVTSFEHIEIVENRMRELERKFSADEGFSCQVHGKFHSPPKCVREDKASIQLRKLVTESACAWGREIQWCDTGGACDGNKFAALGLPNVDTMGPIGGNLHSDREYCEIDSLLTAIKIVIGLLTTMGGVR